MTLPHNLISAILTFMPKRQIYMLMPLIKARHELSKKLLGMFKKIFSKTSVYNVLVSHDQYNTSSILYLNKTDTAWSKFSGLRCEVTKKKYPIGSTEHIRAVKNSRSRIFKEESESDSDSPIGYETKDHPTISLFIDMRDESLLILDSEESIAYEIIYGYCDTSIDVYKLITIDDNTYRILYNVGYSLCCYQSAGNCKMTTQSTNAYDEDEISHYRKISRLVIPHSSFSDDNSRRMFENIKEDYSMFHPTLINPNEYY
jgi:hypothetical protein